MDQFLLALMMGASSGMGPQYDEAASETRRAVMEYQFVKDDIHHLEIKSINGLYNTTGLRPNDLAYVAYLSPLVSQHINSAQLGNLQMNAFSGFKLRPNLDYYFGSNPVLSSSLKLVKDF